jgi:predicted PurR-regulated permease PerM
MPRWLLGLLATGAAIILIPFAPWVVLGVWLGLWAEQVHVSMMRVLGGRRGLAATVTVLLLVSVVLPIGAMTASIVVDAIALVRELLTSQQGQSVLERLVRGPQSTSAASATDRPEEQRHARDGAADEGS